jgi:hypothetical protein
MSVCFILFGMILEHCFGASHCLEHRRLKHRRLEHCYVKHCLKHRISTTYSQHININHFLHIPDTLILLMSLTHS